MPKLTPKNHQLTEHDFIKLAKTEPHPRARTRLFILHQLQQGQAPEEIAPLFGLNPLTIHILRRKYWEFGIEQAIYDKQRPGRSSTRSFRRPAPSPYQISPCQTTAQIPADCKPPAYACPRPPAKRQPTSSPPAAPSSQARPIPLPHPSGGCRYRRQCPSHSSALPRF